MTTLTRRGRTGSSPLARGLRTHFLALAIGMRIIPARAGFTTWARGGPVAQLDHPRSRGVYAPRRCTPRSSSGSSPLARGLLCFGFVVSFRRGIIPARAGFTPPSGRRHCRRRDHPRSRGVYFLGASRYHWINGSSPLARGLLGLGLARVLCCRIIPARAGFTSTNWVEGTLSLDHPRSRGVYRLHWAGRVGAGGSSPLARGLHYFVVRRGATARIIPARAGFTCPGTPRPRSNRDHPRSRGVYSASTEENLDSLGSSPLARGLPLYPTVVLLVVGIIPARAGFTRGGRLRWRSGGDHPRSRGVY